MDVPVADLRELIRRAVAHHGHGRWRLPDDIVDHAYDLLIDHLLRSTAPTDPDGLRAWLVTICLNLARSGPPRADLDRTIVSATTEVVLLTYAASEPPPPHRQLIRAPLLRIASQVLTHDERRAVDAIRTADSMSTAARLADMTPRDLRVRLNRAGVKLRPFPLRSIDHAGRPGIFPLRT